MDPLSIAASCAGLIKAIQEISALISRFVVNCKDARGDLRAVSLELSDVSFTLDLLQGIVKDDDKAIKNSSIPSSIQGNINSIIENCLSISGDIRQILAEYSTGKLSSTRWAIRGKERVQTLKTLLEAHRQALNFAVDTITLAIAKDIKNDTGKILEDTTDIKEDTTKILEEIARLEALIVDKDITGDQNPTDSRAFMLKRYLEDLTTVASSVCDGDFSRPGSPTEFTLPPTIPEDPNPADDGEENETPHPSPPLEIERPQEPGAPLDTRPDPCDDSRDRIHIGEAISRPMAPSRIPFVQTSESQKRKGSMNSWYASLSKAMRRPKESQVAKDSQVRILPIRFESAVPKQETYEERREVIIRRLKEVETKVDELEETDKADIEAITKREYHLVHLSNHRFQAKSHLQKDPGSKERRDEFVKLMREYGDKESEYRRFREASDARRQQLEEARRAMAELKTTKEKLEAEKAAQDAQSPYTTAMVAANAAVRRPARWNIKRNSPTPPKKRVDGAIRVQSRSRN